MIGDKAWFIEFYSPECPHCQKFAPTWQEFYDKYHDEINVGRVDRTVDAGEKLLQMFGVTGCPDFRFLPANGQEYHAFSKAIGRDLESLAEFTLGNGWRATTGVQIGKPNADAPMDELFSSNFLA